MIKLGIVGYGNISKGLEKAVQHAKDIELSAVFTRRPVESVKPLTHGLKVESIDNILKYKDSVDVMVLCGGSAKDLPKQGPEILANFNTVDSFDTHAQIPNYLSKMNNVGCAYGKLGIVSVGWDPGLFSIMRACFESILPVGETSTFWGKGVSQGHSDAVRRVEGVKKAIQYTIPKAEALEQARNGNHNLTARQKHLRECFVVAKDGADTSRIEESIKTMPDYFADYDTVVHFISEKEFDKNHNAMPHGGFVLRNGTTGNGNKQHLELEIKLESNPEFTASIMLAYARANYKLSKEGVIGAITVFDVAPKYLFADTYKTVVKNRL